MREVREDDHEVHPGDKAASGQLHQARSVKRLAARRAWLLTLAALTGLAAFMTAPAAARWGQRHGFGPYPDGNSPLGGLLMDAAGNLYGTTKYGGSHVGCPGKWQCGAVFKLDTYGVETVLY